VADLPDPSPARPLRLENWEYDPVNGRLVGNFVSAAPAADPAESAAPERFRIVLAHDRIEPTINPGGAAPS
jgi:hypothetical protein